VLAIASLQSHTQGMLSDDYEREILAWRQSRLTR